MLIQQIAVGLLIGFVLSKLASFVLHKINFEIQGLYFILVAAIALFAYSASEYLGGNGYLSVYIVGIVIGNSKILHKKSLVAFFRWGIMVDADFAVLYPGVAVIPVAHTIGNAGWSWNFPVPDFCCTSCRNV